MAFTSETVFLLIGFVVPGFILNGVIGLFVPQRPQETTNLLLRYLTFSCLNYGLWSWMIYFLLQEEFFGHHVILAGLAWFVILFMSPVVSGALLGYFSHKELLHRVLARLGIASKLLCPTGWDFKFGNQGTGVWVIVSLKGGERVAGYYGTHSMASSDTVERDLYLERTFRIGDGQWKIRERTDGILIRGDEIRHIEFIADSPKGREGD